VGLIAVAIVSGFLLKALVSPNNLYAIVETTDGSLFRVAEGKSQVARVGDKIGADNPIRTEAGAGAVLKLPDGSRIKMGPESEVLLEQIEDGTRIRLNDGSVSVTPAKQPAGKLYVQNREQTVPVVGATFQAAGTAEPIQTPLSDKFDVASIRPSTPIPAGGGARGNNTTALGCSMGEIQLDPRRFVVTNVNLYTLVTMAYASPGRDCQFFSLTDSLAGGPGWVRSDQFDIQATIPEGTPSYTATQFRKGASREVQKMLQALLADRFKLVLARETREMAGFALVLGKTKDAAQLAQLASETIGKFPVIVVQPGEPLVPRRTGTGDGRSMPWLLEGRDASMKELASRLAALVGRPVVDHTGIAGQFTFEIQYEWVRDASRDIPGLGRPLNSDSISSLLKSLEEQLGLKLEATKTAVEVLVIEHVEKPSEN
jgi:uncharacterized protein (TIGR03435 family)